MAASADVCSRLLNSVISFRKYPEALVLLCRERTTALEFITQPDTTAYLQSWAQELRARCDRVRQLIGDAHWLSDGHHKEAIIRQFLRMYIPSGLTVSRGFVRSPAVKNSCSPEIDILIADPAVHPALFAESDLQIIAPTSLVAQIAIKTNLTKETLLSGLDNIARTQLVAGKYAAPDRIWRSLFFYDVPSTRTPESILETLQTCIAELSASIHDFSDARRSGDAVGAFSFLPNCIATLSQYVLFLAPQANSTINVRLFEVNDLGFACAFADLFSAIRRWYGNPASGELDEIVDSLHVPSPHKLDIRF